MRGWLDLRGLTNLRLLDLRFTAVSDEGLSSLTSLTKLEDLHLGDTLVTDAGVRQLEKLRRLQICISRTTALTCHDRQRGQGAAPCRNTRLTNVVTPGPLQCYSVYAASGKRFLEAGENGRGGD